MYKQWSRGVRFTTLGKKSWTMFVPNLVIWMKAGLEIASPIGWKVRNKDISIRLGRRCRLKPHPYERSNSNQTRNHHAGTPAVCHGLQRTFRYRSISNPYTQGREGYMNAKQWTPNLHAHVVFDWTQPNGKSVRLSRDDMAELKP